MKTKVVFLKNGIKLIHTYVKEVNGVDLQLIFQAGALNDPKGKAGLAHFCEHALSSAFSTEKHTRNERRSMKNKYNYSNAITGLLYMKFLLQVSSNKFEEAFDLMTESFNSMLFKEDEFYKEREIIYDEILTRKRVNEVELDNVIFHNLFKEKEFKNFNTSAAGSIDTVKNITLKDIERFIKEYLTQKNLIIVVSGKISLKRIIKNINKFILTRLPIGEKRGFDFENYLGYKNPCFIQSSAPEEGKSIFNIIFIVDKCKKFSERKEVFKQILFNSCLNEKLFEFYRTNQNLCYNSYSNIYNDNIYNECVITINCNDNNIIKIVQNFTKFLRFFDNQFNETLFNKYKERKIDQVNFDLENLSLISKGRFYEYTQFNEICNSDKIIKKEIESITFNDVYDYYKKAFRSKPYVILISNVKIMQEFDYKEFCKDCKKMEENL